MSEDRARYDVAPKTLCGSRIDNLVQYLPENCVAEMASHQVYRWQWHMVTLMISTLSDLQECAGRGGCGFGQSLISGRLVEEIVKIARDIQAGNLGVQTWISTEHFYPTPLLLDVPKVVRLTPRQWVMIEDMVEALARVGVGKESLAAMVIRGSELEAAAALAWQLRSLPEVPPCS